MAYYWCFFLMCTLCYEKPAFRICIKICMNMIDKSNNKRWGCRLMNEGWDKKQLQLIKFAWPLWWVKMSVFCFSAIQAPVILSCNRHCFFSQLSKTKTFKCHWFFPLDNEEVIKEVYFDKKMLTSKVFN